MEHDFGNVYTLEQRPTRSPDYAAEARAHAPLLVALANRSPRIMQQIVETALSLCGAQTAGLSTPERDGHRELFRWSAMAGAWAHCRDRIVAREGSPSGVALEQDAPLHVISPEQRFAPGAELIPSAVELLQVPFRIEGRPVGTLWIIRHDDARQFDAEDQRRLEGLARLAALAWMAHSPARPAPEAFGTRTREREQIELALIAGKMATWHWNPATDEVTASEAMVALFGLRPGDDWRSIDQGRALIHPDDREVQQALIRNSLEREGGWHHEFRIIRPIDGRVAWLEERAHRIRNPATGEYVITGVVWDITERKNAEEAHQQSEGKLQEVRGQFDQMRRLYESILTNTPDLAYVWNLDHHFIYANEGLLRMWGKSWDEAIGKHCLELGYEPWHAELHDREIDQIVATGQPIRGQVPFAGTFGRRIYDYILVPVLDDNGKVIAVAGTTRDVTESKDTEERLREADQRKDEFLATLAHELRNPLAPLRHGIRIIQQEKATPEAIRQNSAMMDRQLSQLVRLVDDLLDISRISRGRIELRRERVDLRAIIEHATETIRPACDDMQHQLHIELPDSHLWVDGDAARLTQAISNLLTNACRYMERGGNVWISAQQDGGEVELRVKDSGIGIAPDQLRTIFDMYSQGDSSLERSQSGLGIGLTLVQSLVGLHDGRITAHSEGAGKGSEFVVRLPGAAEAPSRVSAEPPRTDAGSPRSPGDMRRILVVDDNTDSAESLAQLLRLLGHETHTAHEGVRGVELAAQLRPDVILLDLGMPKLNGYDACRQIRSQPWGTKVLLVAQSGWGQEEDRRRSRDAGFDAHLVKPIDYEELTKLLASRR